MKKFVRRAAMAALIVSASSVAVVTALEPAYSAPARGGARGRQAQDPATTARREVGTPINDALKLVDMKDFAGALAKVQQADAVQMKTPFEEFLAAKYLGFIAVNQPNPDYPTATAAYNRQVASNAIPEMEKATVYSIAMRLNYQNMDYPRAIANAMELQKLAPLDDTGYLVLIQSYYNTMDFANAVQAAKAEVASKVAAGMKPQEDVLGLLLNAQIRIMDEAGSRQTLDQLATVSSKPEVWGQIIDITLSTPGLTDHQLLNLYRLSILTGTMKDTDYAAMATIDLQSGLPSEAKDILTKANKTGELLTQANQLLVADQRDLPALAAEAAKATTNGEIDVKLGESYWSYGRFDEAIAALQRGIMKGGLKDTADAQTTLGIALFSAGKRAEAAQAFQQASAAADTPAGRTAHAWALYLQRLAAA